MTEVTDIIVAARAGETVGTLTAGARTFICSLGRSGLTSSKHEGDGGTPIGSFRLRQLFYRPDRGDAPKTGLPVQALTKSDGWCDAPEDPHYNQRVDLPYPASAETMWRSDGLYDLCCVIGYNDAPVEKNRGSAIFLHLMREEDGEIKPTEGCVALRRPDFEEVLALCSPETVFTIEVI